MRWLTAVFLGLLLWGQSGLASAGDAVRAFASELMLHESKQVLQPDRPLKYSDPEGGAALRALLAPARTAAVLDDYFAELVKGTDQPDVSKLAGPLVKRYEKAFAANPGAYEEEYLDSLNWIVSTLEGSARVASANMQKNAAAPRADAEAVQKVLESLQSLSDTMMKMVVQVIRDKVNSGVFGAAGKERALSMADRINATLRPAPAAALNRASLRNVMNGKQVYDAQCAACHASGIAGAPRAGNVSAWRPLIASGFDSLVRSTLQGKGAMAPQAGGNLQDFEIARAVAYLANMSGGAFKEPALPAGHPGTVTVKLPPVQVSTPRPPEVPHAVMTAAQRMQFGQRVYWTNCAACHQADGQAVGPIKTMVNAPAFRENATAIDLLLFGSGRGAMPRWAMLSDEEIAEVINYSRARFGTVTTDPATPAQVRSRRK